MKAKIEESKKHAFEISQPMQDRAINVLKNNIPDLPQDVDDEDLHKFTPSYSNSANDLMKHWSCNACSLAGIADKCEAREWLLVGVQAPQGLARGQREIPAKCPREVARW